MFDAVCKGVLALVMIGAVVSAETEASEAMRERREKSLLETSHAVYRVFQGENEVGTESITREVYNDNTIVFKSTIELVMSDEVSMAEESELVLEEESYFPRSYRVNKRMRHGETVVESRISVEMFANVARMEKDIQGKSEKRNIVLPTGTPLVSADVIHPVYQLLFWYDRDKGGRQAFRVFEISRRVPEEVVLTRGDRENVMIAGTTAEVDVYVLEWPTQRVRYYVDDEGRVVATDMGFMRTELTEWNARASKDEG